MRQEHFAESTTNKDYRGESPKSRSRKRRKRFIPSLLLRVVMILTLIAVTAAISWTALVNISRPYVIGAEQSTEIAEKASNLRQLQADNSRLTQTAAFLSRPDGIEFEARLKGYLLPGERSLVVTPKPATSQ